MMRRNLLIAVVVLLCSGLNAYAEQTIVFLRHAEKPSAGLGQLTCQGLNRALALPTILISRYGTPDFVYAPNPEMKMSDPGGSFYYVRPLATIEPTAIRAAKSVNTKYGFTEITGLQSLLIQSTKADSTIFVVWDHVYLPKIVQNIMNQYGGGVQVPAWTTGDYDSLYVVHVNYGSTISATFHIDKQGLNGQPTTCPQ
jgi:hypothetical protein